MSHTETEKDVAGGSAAVADNGAAALPPALPPADQVELVGKREETDLTGTTPAPLQPPVKPWGLSWRAAPWFITTVVTVAVTSDILAYTIVVPVLPYRLQDKNYDNVASLMSWLLFAYSAGVFIATFPVAYYFHKHPWRRGPLVMAVVILELSFLLFMLANPYWCMVVSRFLQGAASCVVWTVGFALICENIDPAHVGTHLGFAFSGVSFGATIAPPIGGALYRHMGWHAPFVFVMIVCGVDTIARVFILEKRDLEKWNRIHNTHLAAVAASEAAGRAASGTVTPVAELEAADKVANGASSIACRTLTDGAELEKGSLENHKSSPATTQREREAGVETEVGLESESPATTTESAPAEEKELSPIGVLVALATIPRGTVAFTLFFVFGFMLGALDATLTLRVETVWHKDSDFVGLIYLAAAAPAFFVGPVSGWLADKYGPEKVLVPTIIFCLPWIPLLILKTSLAGFIVFFAFTNMGGTMLNSVASLEMARVSHFKPGISEIHQFAAMNVAFAISSAIGAVVGGQIYNGLSNGWAVVCWVCFAVTVVGFFPAFFYSGANPFFWRMIRRPPPLSVVAPADRPAAIAEREAWKAARQAAKSSA